ncbi:Protein of unknown function [Bacillus cytotoxicus]|uniref:Uncharacterized protein n=1 Tax=Bacillus cytotoxicus TaxID=580165 RepID=A0AAX2CNF7_9BACI|nr:Protein of unknown function [Bacillus cytotoxicus]SCN42641.1 Protein of unknown function [Bacillus cytotoxicus]
MALANIFATIHVERIQAWLLVA